MTARRRVGLIGAGVMGHRHARVIATHPACTLHAVVDHSVARAASAGQHAGAAPIVSVDPTALAGCDLVVVAVGSGEHHSVTLPLLEAGTPVLVEKPLAMHLHEVHDLLTVARRNDVPLAAGFVQRHHPAWIGFERATASLPRSGTWVATRCSPQVPRAQGSAVLDLMIHDLDLFDRWIGGAAVTTDWTIGGDGTHLTANAAAGDLALTFHANRHARTTERTIEFRTDGGDVRVDLLTGTVTVTAANGGDRSQECVGPEPLVAQWQWFLDLVDGAVDRADEWDALARVHAQAIAVDTAGQVRA